MTSFTIDARTGQRVIGAPYADDTAVGAIDWRQLIVRLQQCGVIMPGEVPIALHISDRGITFRVRLPRLGRARRGTACRGGGLAWRGEGWAAKKLPTYSIGGNMKPIDKAGLGPIRYEVLNRDGTTTVFVKPPDWIGEHPAKSVTLRPDQYQRYLAWRHAEILIQDALPELTTDEREILLNGDPDA